MSPKPFILLALLAALDSAVSGPALAAGAPFPLLIVADPAQEMLQAQLGIQHAQDEARLAASQAKVQAELKANQARLRSQLAAEQARTQAQLAAERESTAAAAATGLANLSLLTERATQERLADLNGGMRLSTMTPRLGRYFGTDHGVLVVRASTHGVLKLQDGDVILSIGDRTPQSSSQAIRILTSYDPGETIKLVVLREHRRIHIMATLPAPPAAP